MPEGITDFSSQRPAIDVIPPALTRHVSFRLIKAENPRFTKGVDWTTILASLSGHIERICKACGVERERVAHDAGQRERTIVFLPPDQVSNEAELKYSISRSAIVTVKDSKDAGYRFRIRIDVYTEMLSLTYIIDRISENFVGTVWETLETIDADDDNLSAERRMAALDWLYGQAWMPGGVLPCMAEIFEWCCKREVRNIGHRLADFRGIALRTRQTSEPGDLPGQPLRKSLAPGLGSFFERHTQTGLIEHATGRIGDQAPSPMAGEPVLCGMLDGEALYIAELGRRSDVESLEPVRHLIVFDRSPAPQIGRLIRRLHILGEYRHAALMDYDNGEEADLKSVSRELRNLGPDLDKELKLESVGDRSIGELSNLMQRVGQLTANAEEGGLSYRVEQSRYYALQFTKTVPHLRTLKIRHYQSYDDFVARYIYQLFARIDRIGVRYDAFLRRLNLLTTFRLSKEIENYQAKVEGALGKLGSTVTKLADATDRVSTASGQQIRAADKQIDLLQEAAFLGLLILVHYTGDTLLHLYEVPSWIDSFPLLSEHHFVIVWNGLTIATATTFLILVVKRMLK